MFRKTYRRISLFAIVIIAFVSVMGSQLTARASTGIFAIDVFQFDCSTFSYHLTSATPGGYAALRIYVGATIESGTPLVDSYATGYPSSYALINTSPAGAEIHFPTQPAGTTLTARVYRALAATPSSWDSGSYVNTTISCKYGIHAESSIVAYCGAPNSEYAFEVGLGHTSPLGGYAAVRIWANNVPIVDSYISGHPSHYEPVNSNGVFYNFTVSFAPQPPGTVILARVYHALSAVPFSWDNGDFVETTTTCQSPVTVTPTPGTP